MFIVAYIIILKIYNLKLNSDTVVSKDINFLLNKNKKSFKKFIIR
jgi:hypothetical protein